MVSLASRQAQITIAAAATLLALIVCLTPGHSLAVEADAEDDRLLTQVQEILSRDGPYSLDLLEPLTGLGLLYQESEDHVLALATLERAVQIVRINNGLHSLDQVPLLRQLIRIEQARGNAAGAWDREQYLLALTRRHLDDLRTVPVLREIADEQMRVLGLVLDGKKPPQVVLGCFYKQWASQRDGGCHAGSRETVVQGMLAEAQRNYSDAIGVLLQHGMYGSDELRDLELRLLRGVDFLRALNTHRGNPLPLVPREIMAASLEPWRSRMAPVIALAAWDAPGSGEPRVANDKRNIATRHLELMDPYQRGRQSLGRLHAYSAASGVSVLGQAAAALQIADWDLLHSRNGRAVTGYALIHEALEHAGVAQASIDELFSPAMPVVLPAFQPNPLARNETRVPTGHVDVTFEITKYGRSRAIEIRGVANAPATAQQRLVTLIKANRFRPQAIAGQFVDATPVALRYHLYE
jgi:hypothetical protein